MSRLVWTTYRGYDICCHHKDITAIAPNGDTATFPSMSSIRQWIREHRKLAGLERQAA